MIVALVVRERKFRLVSTPRRKARVGKTWQAQLVAYLEMPKWDDGVVAGMEAIADEHHDCDSTDEEEDLFFRVYDAVAEWKRLKETPPLPSTACLRRQLSIPSREERAIQLWNKIQHHISERVIQCERRMRKFKTYKAEYNQRQRVLAKDPKLPALKRYEEMLCRYVPNVRSLAGRRKAGW